MAGNLFLNVNLLFINPEMGNHFTEEIHGPYFIMCSDEDQPKVMDLYAGYNSRKQLVIACDFSDYDDEGHNCATAAIVDKEDAEALAKRLDVSFEELPKLISDNMEEWREIINPDCDQVVNCFTEITEMLVEDGCRYKIVRKYGKNDFFWF